mmetsp:Transcript_140841/g.351118  ORF Transcript_140841/g.351118 Transcript_140841/m.351118 type:complete len:178 (-) Transcript_140841:101-634(-)
MHSSQSCKPCAFAHTEAGCVEGIMCRFCHFTHPAVPRLRPRPCKNKRERCKKLVDKLVSVIDEDPDSYDPTRLPPAIRENPTYMARLTSHHERALQARQAAAQVRFSAATANDGSPLSAGPPATAAASVIPSTGIGQLPLATSHHHLPGAAAAAASSVPGLHQLHGLPIPYSGSVSL